MKIKLFIIIGAMAILASGVFVARLETCSYFKTPDKTETLLPPTSESTMAYLINWERQKEGLGIIIENPKLQLTAKRKACDMKERDYFAHIDPDGVSYRNYLDEVDYERKLSGENLIKYSHSNIDAMKLLMESEGHKKNILDPDFEEFGIGECEEYTVQHFGLSN